MENTQAIYEQNQQKCKQTYSQTQTGDTSKRNLIIKNKTLNISLRSNHIEVNNGVLSQIYGIAQINKLYLHKDIVLSISECFEISKHLKIFFIDANGNIVAKYKRSKIL